MTICGDADQQKGQGVPGFFRQVKHGELVRTALGWKIELERWRKDSSYWYKEVIVSNRSNLSQEKDVTGS